MDEYASMRFRSRCANAAHAENTIVMTASHSSGVSTQLICCGKIGSRMRMKPYTPIFDITPVSSIVTGDGASAYVAGSHVWNGINGTFTAKPSSTPPKMIRRERLRVQASDTSRSLSDKRASQRTIAAHLREFDEIHFAGREEDGEERQQHRHAADHGIDEELRRRRTAIRSAPESHEEERRDQTQFPEEEPVEKVQRRERADEPGLQEQDQ
jgi:hypothetical protein